MTTHTALASSNRQPESGPALRSALEEISSRIGTAASRGTAVIELEQGRISRS